MYMPVLAEASSGVINLDQPGTYVTWSIFTVSVANLALIAAMVVIFAVALVLPFSKGRTYPGEDELPAGTAGTLAGSGGQRGKADLGEDEDAGMWTARLRRRALSAAAAGQAAARTASPPTSPPGCTSSASPAWPRSGWRSSRASPSRSAGPTGGTPTRSATSSTACTCGASSCSWRFLVIHLWGKFWMAAWRGRRAMTWITGVVAFMASVVECFTGYLSQQNFDSQWISTNGKDAFNSVGIGAFFNADELRPDAALARRAGARSCWSRSSARTSCWSGSAASPTRCPPSRAGAGTARERRKARKAADAAPLARPDPALRHHQGGHHRRPW